MEHSVYSHIAKDRYDIITARNEQFREVIGDPNKEPIRVYDPLSKKQLEELELIREVSRELQARKEADMKQQEEAAAKQVEELKATKAKEEDEKK